MNAKNHLMMPEDYRTSFVLLMKTKQNYIEEAESVQISDSGKHIIIQT